MAFNPFLSINEPTAAVTTDDLNPFMMADTNVETFVAAENPFAASNPFSDFGVDYEPPAGDTVPMNIFGGVEAASIGAKQFDDTPSMNIFGNTQTNTERIEKPTELDLIPPIVDCTFSEDDSSRHQPPARPLPPETQNLILSVTGQMEFTSSDLLDRIPPTRTPSPVSVRDIHSPSPTPEPDMLAEPAVPDSLDINRNKPARPPPARPPRPAPPPRPQQPPQQPSQQPSQPVVDDINLFDAPVPVTVKPTKEAILSLYSAPKKEEKQIDFLSDDIPDFQSSEVEMIPPNVQEPAATMDSSNIFFTEQPAAKNDTQPSVANSELNPPEEVPMDCSEPPTEFNTASLNASPFADITDNDDSHNGKSDQITHESNPFETKVTEDNNVFNTEKTEMLADSSQPEYTESPFSMQNDAFESAPTEIQSENIFTSEPSNVFQEPTVTSTNIFGDNQTHLVSQMQSATATDDWNTIPSENLAQDAFAGSQDAFAGSQDAFAGSQDAFAGSKDAFAESQGGFPESQDAFDAFSAKFDSAGGNQMNTDAWGDDGSSDAGPAGFEAEAFDPFLSMGAPPPPAATPRLDHQASKDSIDDTFSVFIKPKESDAGGQDVAVPVLAPPPRPQVLPDSPRVNPFDKSGGEPTHESYEPEKGETRGSGGETPPTPLFDDDVSVPLEDFPRIKYDGPGWEMHLRQPNKKKITGQRFWKKIFVRLVYQGDTPAVQLLNSATDKEPIQELPLQACYSVSDIGAQQFDQFGKIFTVKLQYIFYKERPGVRPGQVTKAERITNKLSQFAAYAIQGDYQGVKEFGSDLRKLGLPVEHAPQVSQLFKVGSLSYEDVKQFSSLVEEALFRIPVHRDRALTYKMEEVQITAVDELYVEQDAEGAVLKQIARVRLFFLAFLSGMPDVELGVNDLRRQGREVVGRHDIIPVVTEEWIRVEAPEFHACVSPQDFHDSQIIKFKPPDACYIELLRFRVRPPRNRELPLQLKAVWCVTGNRVELRADVLVPGFTSRRLGQVPCEDVAIRFEIPECWIYLFRVEKHFRYGSVKSAHRRTGKIKGIERFLGAVDTLQESLIEVTSGQAKYEHQHRAIVWRMPRLPKEGQGAYTTHNLVCRMALTSYDQVPAELARWAHVEFTMPATAVSHVTVRSVSLQNYDNDPPEKYVRYLARHEYKVGIERTTGQSVAAYSLAAAKTDPAPAPAPAPAPVAAPPSSDSDSD